MQASRGVHAWNTSAQIRRVLKARWRNEKREHGHMAFLTNQVPRSETKTVRWRKGEGGARIGGLLLRVPLPRHLPHLLLQARNLFLEARNLPHQSTPRGQELRFRGQG